MPTPQEERERLAIAIADGVPIDWGRIEVEGVLSPNEIRTLRALEALRVRAPGFPSEGLTPGKVVGDFRLLAMIGQGGMGQVWEAEQISLGNRRVAVKFVRPERVTERQLELFAREARAGGRLSHPGIVTVHSHGTSDGLAWIAMEFVSGAWTLKSFLDEVTRTDEVPAGHDLRVARIVAETAEAVQAAHAAGVIHRDLKPQNVLLTPEDRPKVTDFGLARIQDESALSQSGDIAGTYLYMSPEQVLARRTGIDHRTDVFSLGIVLYECLALRRPFEGDTSHQVAAQILAKDPPDPRTIRSRVPRDLAVIAGKALEKDRDMRFQTMREFAADLRRFLAGEAIHARPPTRLDRTIKWVKRNPGKSSAAAIMAVTFTVIALLLAANIRTNRALSAKTVESEERRVAAEHSAELAKQNEQRAVAGETLAKANEQRAVTGEALAKESERIATERADDVLRLSALQKLEDLTTEGDGLWPARPPNIERYDAWLARAEALMAELPGHERKLAELRSKSVPLTAEEQAKHRAEHPMLAELEGVQRELEYSTRLRSVLESGELGAEPTAAEVGVNPSSLPATAEDVNSLAWPLIDPERKGFGGERKGLVLARLAVELAAGLSPAARAGIRNSLAWALFANGRFDEALAEEEQALEEAGADKKKDFGGFVAKLRAAIEAAIDPEQEAHREKHRAELETRIAGLEAEISERPEWVFTDAQDKWWHNQLEKLVNGLRSFADANTGLFSEGTSEEHGWGMKRRLASALLLRAGFAPEGEQAKAWSAALPEIRAAYPGLALTPQLGLVPIGPDPQSGLWEFAHLETGEPAARGMAGKLVLKEDTGLVFVLLPGGTFQMGAQNFDPNGVNYDPEAGRAEGPVHAVTLSAFFLSKYEMTLGQWEHFTGKNPNYLKKENYSLSFNAAHRALNKLYPVDHVSWFDCRDAMWRMGFSFPSEAQWEYGARGGAGTVWWCGDRKESLQGVANIADRYAKEHGGDSNVDYEMWIDDGNTASAEIGQYRANAFGLHDVIGNVFEWCGDTNVGGVYKQVTTKDPVFTKEFNHVPRGGSFFQPALLSRSANRENASPSTTASDLGLRPARTITR